MLASAGIFATSIALNATLLTRRGVPAGIVTELLLFTAALVVVLLARALGVIRP